MSTDVDELKEVLSVVSTEIPKLLTAISESLFNAEQTGQYAQAVADFYKSLREAGMNEEQAFELTQGFMDKTNFAAMIQEIVGGRGPLRKLAKARHEAGEDIGAAIEDAVKEKIKEKFEEKGSVGDEE